MAWPGGRFIACRYFCNPQAIWTCYAKEARGSKCLDFTRSYKGKCYNGNCVTIPEYEEKKKNGLCVPGRVCDPANDFNYISYYGSFGCHYHCFLYPFRHVPRPDGHECLIPRTAENGTCDGSGNCIRD
uniref:7DB family n=1 Tax=Argas monolakensis TaxID=34602 RepID=Q09JJ0_ARGMO|nr:7DB family [Argas monolakensis]